MDNRQNYLSFRIDVEKVAKGDLIVFLKLRGHKLIRAVSEYRPGQGTLENDLLGGDEPGNSNAPASSLRGASATTRRPAHPLAVPRRRRLRGAKFKILTEIGPDADLAPADGEDPEADVDLEHLGRAGLI